MKVSRAQARRLRKGEVVCDSCQKRFRMAPQMEAWGEGGECHWFSCPHCGARYVMAYVTAKGVQIRGWIQALKERLAETPAGPERAELAQEWEGLQAMMGREVSSPAR